MSTEVSAGIIIYRKTKDGPRFLLLYNGGQYWNFPKGKLDGESNFKAALREVREETGFLPENLRFRDWFKVRDKFVFIRDKQKVFKTVTYYLAETNNSVVKIKMSTEDCSREQHYGYGWFLYRDALRMLIHPNLKRNLKRAHDIIIRKKSPRNYARNTQKQGVNVQGNSQETRQ